MTALPEWTFAMIKPDAVRKGKAQEIKQLIEIHGFHIIADQKIQLTRTRAQEFYAEHHGKAFFEHLVDFMTSGPVFALVLSKHDAITGWRKLMGPTNSISARETAPKSLRAMYGTDGTKNACHGSDSPTSAGREVKFFFPALVIEPFLEPGNAKAFITDMLQPALAKALTALAREKPSAEKFEAITYLATFLLENNPNKPRIIMPDEWDPTMEEEDDEAEFAHAQLTAAMVKQGAATSKAPEPEAAETKPAAEEVISKEEAPVATPASTISVEEKEAQKEKKRARRREWEERRKTREAAAIATATEADKAEEVEEAAGQVTSAMAEGLDDPPPAAASQGGAPEPDEETNPTGDGDVDADAMNKAATKVQSTFRGYQARKRVEDIKASEGAAAFESAQAEEEPEEVVNAAVAEDIEAEALNKAATKVQSTFRGYQARKRVEDIKASKGAAASEGVEAEEGESDQVAELPPADEDQEALLAKKRARRMEWRESIRKREPDLVQAELGLENAAQAVAEAAASAAAEGASESAAEALFEAKQALEVAASAVVEAASSAGAEDAGKVLEAAEAVLESAAEVIVEAANEAEPGAAAEALAETGQGLMAMEETVHAAAESILDAKAEDEAPAAMPVVDGAAEAPAAEDEAEAEAGAADVGGEQEGAEGESAEAAAEEGESAEAAAEEGESAEAAAEEGESAEAAAEEGESAEAAAAEGESAEAAAEEGDAEGGEPESAGAEAAGGEGEEGAPEASPAPEAEDGEEAAATEE
ncbi:hypothetical protein CEUSTIGMA_g3960.t1 [Chlamydomonas eustigma]|uniref:Nucleoside diphosphate kinase-like domain-containing protein n=1 Tax=Chlamydomonas eustigma TaxID=1157962 RepID=A0A250X0A1_9CHLO|nr:hypothetical protein CEUSTIGMA_g3960.t1 [Chlamydomonas eustigma]|eukprot:GAX76514.1 hypothetical protein CEUSTIGMA_g3960.t1 [Chlamydomonas eustigma]